jgi:hypothetical protein
MTDNTEIEDFFGEAKEANSGSSLNWKQHTISDKQPNIYRIAPPLKTSTSGRWKVHGRVHYGYMVPNEQNPDKPRHKPFLCIQKKNYKTKMIEQDCPECSLLQYIQSQFEAQEKNLIERALKEGKSKEVAETEAKEFISGVRKSTQPHNLDSKWFVLAKNLSGEWAILKLGTTAMKAFEDACKKYTTEMGEDPLNAKTGVWFEFTRTGLGFDTRYTATVAMESLGKGQYQIKSGALTAADAEGIKKCPKLDTLNDNKILSYEQIKALVESKGDPEKVEAVFAQIAPQTPRASPPVVSKPIHAPVAIPAVSVQPAKALNTEMLLDEEAELMEKLKSLQAAKKASQPKPAEPVAVKSQDFQKLLEMDPEALLALFPDPNIVKK